MEVTLAAAQYMLTVKPPGFDENMVGLNGPNKKVLVTHVRRLLRKAGSPKASSKEIENLLSASALTYIKEEFVK